MSSDEFGSFSYIRVPPDSTGKRSLATRLLAIDYTAGTVLFAVGDIIEGQSSGATAKVVRVSGVVSSGTIYVQVEETSTAATFTVGETLLVESVSHATIGAITPMYAQATVLAGGSDLLNVQDVSNRGSAYVRYAEGEQLVDAFGITKVGQSDLVDQITFAYGTNTYRFYDMSSSVNATLTHLTNSNSITLDVDTAQGDYFQRTTHVYYPYHPGFAALTEMTLVCGDSGKDGNERRWGRFDDSDGVYFELSGSALYICLRSSTGGSTVTTKISQSAWNGDHLNGEGGSHNLSTYTLDVAKLNLYWIDYAWLGAGQIRFGVYGPDGARIVAHKIGNAGQHIAPYMKKGSLPFRCEISNSQATAGPSRLTLTCVAIKNEGIKITPESKFTTQWTYMMDQAVSASSDTWTPVMAWRGTPYIGTIPNRLLSFPGTVGGYVTAPTAFKLYNLAVLNTASWTQFSVSGLEFAASASSILGGAPVAGWFVEASSSFNEKLAEHSSISLTATSKANSSAGNTWVVAAKSLVPGVSSSVIAKMSWSDLE